MNGDSLNYDAKYCLLEIEFQIGKTVYKIFQKQVSSFFPFYIQFPHGLTFMYFIYFFLFVASADHRVDEIKCENKNEEIPAHSRRNTLAARGT